MAEEAIFSFVLETLRDLVIQEARFLVGVEDQVERLQQELNHMHWFLRDTSATNQDGKKRVLEWVLRVRDIAYEAENVIETYAIKVASRGRGGIVGNIKRFAGALNECYHRHQIGSDIETLLSKISDLTNSFDRYGIRQIIENRDDGASRRPLLRRTYSMVNDEDELFVGSDDSINMLAEKLVSSQYRTITIYGMGGLGKTTLARKVYHHPLVTKHFDGFAWVSISQQWHKEDILRGILIKLMPDQKRDDIQKWRDEELVRELSRFFYTSKCLLVLDDIWSIDAWDSIKSAIHVTERGSKVLLTTRNVEVGTLVDASGYLHEPKILTVDESWELLCNKALRGQGSKEITKKERIGKEMVKKCGGLPLAVVALGGILSSKSSDDQWRSVSNNVKSYLRNVSRNETNVEAILSLSYDDMPFQLKPCFLYMSKYAEDTEIDVESLYQYWMAEGMVSSDDRQGNDETIMDVAEHYLNELAERCMVFVQKEGMIPFTRFKSCRLHDLMRDLCIAKAKEEKFLESIDYGNIHDLGKASSLSTRTICRLSINLDNVYDVKRFFPHEAVKRSLRSFTLNLHDGHMQNNIIKFKFGEFVMLRVLSIEGIRIEDLEVRSVVNHTSLMSKLVHLRYLMLRNTGFSSFMSSISNLKQLQTLDLRGQKVVWKPNVILKLPRLNHLYLPMVMHRSYSRKKLGFDGMPQLEILEGFGNKVCNVNQLWKLTNLRKLEARVDDNLGDLGKLINHVRKLTHLRFLVLTIRIFDLSSDKAVGIINDILSYSNLVLLWIEGKLNKFPDYDNGLCRNLRILRLWECEIEEDPVRTLERLPNLRKLTLDTNCFVGKEMSCYASGFPKLRVLLLLCLDNLEKWEIEDGAMPNLSHLTIDWCSKLEMIPAGLRSNTLLKTLDIDSMPEEFKKRVRVNEDGEEGPDFYKVRHVETINAECSGSVGGGTMRQVVCGGSDGGVDDWGLMSKSDTNTILQDLGETKRKIEAGEIVWRTDSEDVHMKIEAALTDILGEPAKKLYTTRTKNDQVCTHFRLWCKDASSAFLRFCFSVSVKNQIHIEQVDQVENFM